MRSGPSSPNAPTKEAEEFLTASLEQAIDPSMEWANNSWLSEDEHEQDDLDAHFRIGSNRFDRMLYAVTNQLSRARTVGADAQKKWNLIIPHLILGIIPNKEDALEIKAEFPNLGLVVSSVQTFEIVDNQHPDDWEKVDVNHHHVSIADFTSDVKVSNILETIRKMHDRIEKGFDVYVHCKAGRGRSALIVACYLAAYARGEGKPLPGNAKAEDILAFMKSIRPQVKLKERHFKLIRSVIEKYGQQPLRVLSEEPSWANPVKKMDADTFFALTQTKRIIANLSSFKALKIFADTKPDTRKFLFIGTVFQQILHADDADWFYQMNAGIKLPDKSPPSARSEQLATLINRFKDDINSLVDINKIEIHEIDTISLKDVAVTVTPKSLNRSLLDEAKTKDQFLQALTLDVENKTMSRSQVLNIFAELKNREGKYSFMHQQNHAGLDAFRMLFKSSRNSGQQEETFWHTTSYQKAIKLLKNALLATDGNERAEDSAALINYYRGNAMFKPARTASKKLQDELSVNTNLQIVAENEIDEDDIIAGVLGHQKPNVQAKTDENNVDGSAMLNI
jgi:protein-tyrosine phosphatase